MMGDWRESPDIDCHFGDHDWAGAICKWCGKFDGSMLQFARFDKADKAGTLIWHGDPEDENDTGCHYHFTEKAAANCRKLRSPLHG